MLVKYTVSNFMSIGYEVTLDMRASGSPTVEAYSTEVKPEAQVEATRILRRAAVFGPNASGKTALLKSIDFAKRIIINGMPKRAGFTQQFAVPLPELNGTSFFEFTLYINNGIYSYGFIIDSTKICEEWLEQIYGENEVQPLFVRRTDSGRKTEIEFAEKYFPQDSDYRKGAELLVKVANASLSSCLFLSKLKDLDMPEIKPIYDWFYQLRVIYPNSSIIQLPNLLKTNTELTKYLERKLAALDTGIAEIKAVDEPLSFDEVAVKLGFPRELMEKLAEDHDSMIFLGGKVYFTSGSTLREVKFTHLLMGTKVDFSLEGESDGTRRLIDLLPMMFMLNNGNFLCCVDEFERSLHPKLTLSLLDDMLRINTSSQLIFTSHDVGLLNFKHFHQDEIWFIEKSQEGESLLQPLSDFDLSRGQDPLKSYLAGRFGAVPEIRELPESIEE